MFGLLLAVSARLVAQAWRGGILFTERSPVLYHASTLGFNYFEFGAIRRGLGGSIVHLFGSNLLWATALFHLLCAAACSLAICLLFLRLRATGWQKLVFALVAVAFMARWADDAGRTDLAIAALLGFAAVAAQRGAFALACLCVAAGLFIHETSFVYGVALLAALRLNAGASRPFSWRVLAPGLCVLASALAVYALLGWLPRADVATMVDTVRAKLPRHEHVDWAIYFAVGGQRGVRTSICQNLGDPTYALHIATGLLAIALSVALLAAGRRPTAVAALLASVLPFVFLSIVANDLSRWAVLAAYNAWLVCATSRAETATVAGGWMLLRLAVAAMMLPLLHPKTVRIDDPIFMPMPVVDRLARHVGGPTTTRFAEALARCDPNWREVLGDRPQGAVR